jgi:hypothetical protein
MDLAETLRAENRRDEAYRRLMAIHAGFGGRADTPDFRPATRLLETLCLPAQ